MLYGICRKVQLYISTLFKKNLIDYGYYNPRKGGIWILECYLKLTTGTEVKEGKLLVYCILIIFIFYIFIFISFQFVVV